MSRRVRFGLQLSAVPWSVAFCAATLLVAAPVTVPRAAYATGADYCVICKGPDATYRCRVQGSGATSSDAFKLYCVVRTAKEGGHASCSAKNATADCVGPQKVYNYDGPSLPAGAAAERRVQKLNEKVEREQRAFDRPDKGQPKSLFELGGRAVDASRRGLRNAGAAIGIGAGAAPEAAPPPAAPPPQATQDEPPRRGFARRSWDCMASFFRDCRGD